MIHTKLFFCLGAFFFIYIYNLRCLINKGVVVKGGGGGSEISPEFNKRGVKINGGRWAEFQKIR